MLTASQLIIKEYFDREYQLESILHPYTEEIIAMESDENNKSDGSEAEQQKAEEIKDVAKMESGDDNKEKKGKSFGTKIVNLFRTIKDWILKFAKYIELSVKELLNSDKSWAKRVHEVVNKNKPKTIKVINYNYDDAFISAAEGKLENIRLKFKSELMGIIDNPSKLDEDSSLLHFTTEKMATYIAKGIGLENTDKINSFPNLYTALRNKFRTGAVSTNENDSEKGKKEIVIKYNEIQEYVKKSLNDARTHENMKSRMNGLKIAIESAERTAENKMKNPNVTDEDKTKITTAVSSYGKFVNAYISALKVTTQLRIERVINCRAIVKKAYSM